MHCKQVLLFKLNLVRHIKKHISERNRSARYSYFRGAECLLRLTIFYATGFILSLLSTACEHRDLCYDHPHSRIPLVVEFDWSKDTSALPEGMTVYFFRMDPVAEYPYIFDFKGNQGGTVYLSRGTYAALCFNNDSDRHGFVGSNSHYDFGLRLGDWTGSGDVRYLPSRVGTVDGERIANTPDRMWVGSVPVVTVEIPDQNIAARTETQSVCFEMLPAVYEYTFIIHHPQNYRTSTYVSGMVSGMSGTLHPGRGMTGSETVVHPFDMHQLEDGSLVGSMLTFGHCASNLIRALEDDEDVRLHNLTVNAILADGRSWSKTYDVTRQLHDYPDMNMNCVVELDTVDFPHGSSGGGGFVPNVGGWSGNSETIGM